MPYDIEITDDNHISDYGNSTGRVGRSGRWPFEPVIRKVLHHFRWLD